MPQLNCMPAIKEIKRRQSKKAEEVHTSSADQGFGVNGHEEGECGRENSKSWQQ